jgi:hypothetical protein
MISLPLDFEEHANNSFLQVKWVERGKRGRGELDD